MNKKLTTPAATPSPLPETVQGLEIDEMQRAIGDETAEAADVFEYLDGPDGNFASEPAPEGWETGGNEREKANKFTDAEKERFRYEEYCQCKMEIDEIPLTIDQWREIDEYGNRGNEQGGFTPGEWEAKYNTELFPGQAAIYGCDGDENGRVIAVMDTSDETDTANIDLVCKAPKLYYALKNLVETIQANSRIELLPGAIENKTRQAEELLNSIVLPSK